MRSDGKKLQDLSRRRLPGFFAVCILVDLATYRYGVHRQLGALWASAIHALIMTAIAFPGVYLLFRNPERLFRVRRELTARSRRQEALDRLASGPGEAEPAAWCFPGCRGALEMADRERFVWWYDRIDADGAVAVSDVDGLPPRMSSRS